MDQRAASHRDHNASAPHGTFDQFVRTRYLCKRNSFPDFKARPPRPKSVVQIPSCRHLGLYREIIAPQKEHTRRFLNTISQKGIFGVALSVA